VSRRSEDRLVNAPTTTEASGTLFDGKLIFHPVEASDVPEFELEGLAALGPRGPGRCSESASFGGGI
jgi:hypothetical protein